jgi:hypothetical protein
MKIKIVKNSGHQWDAVNVETGKPVNDFAFMSATAAADWADEQGYDVIDDIMLLAKQVASKKFDDGKKWSAMLADGSVIRCASQDGAETVAMQGKSNAKFAHKDNYVEVLVDAQTIGLVWPQS